MANNPMILSDSNNSIDLLLAARDVSCFLADVVPMAENEYSTESKNGLAIIIALIENTISSVVDNNVPQFKGDVS